jgi:hypothetical protein
VTAREPFKRDMNTTEIVVLVLVAVLIVAAVIVFQRRRTTESLRSKFGPEYGRAVDESGGERKAQAQLKARVERVAQYGLRPLSPEQRKQFEAEWREVQKRFVDDPKGAATQADDLLGRVMTARGYPEGDFDHRLEDLSVDHAQTIQDYRAAHDAVLRHARGEAGTEDMRQAIIHYRALFDELVGGSPEAEAKTAPQRGVHKQ